MQTFVCMSTALCTSGNIVEVVNALNGEWNVIEAFNVAQVSALVVYHGQLDGFDICDE
jgi:hypothetical protein